MCPPFLEFLDSLPMLWLCLNAVWGTANSPCLNCSSWVLRTEAISSGYCPPFPVWVSVYMIADGLGHFSPWCSWRAFLREVNGITMDAQELSQGGALTLRMLAGLSGSRWFPCKASIFSLLTSLLANPHRSCSGKASDPEAPQGFAPLCWLWASPHWSPGGL